MRGETRGLVPWVSLALFAFPVLVWALWAWTPLGFWPAAYSALLLQLLPALALAQLPLVEEEENLPRIPVYLSSGATILILGWLGLVVGGRSLGGRRESV